MKLIFNHEADRAGNRRIADTYEIHETDLRHMIERDRTIRAQQCQQPAEKLDDRSPQDILNDLWREEERAAHSYHRTDRACGAPISYEELANIGQEPQERNTLQPEEYIITQETAMERTNLFNYAFAALQTLPHCQQIIIGSVFFRGFSQADTARQLGVSRAAVSKQLKAALGKLRKAVEDARTLSTQHHAANPHGTIEERRRP